MTISIDEFVLDKEYVDGDLLGEGDLDSALVDATDGSVEQYINNKIRLNLTQLAKDIMPSAYTFNDDGEKSLTNTIFDKQTEELTYEGGDIDIDPNTTDLDFALVNATDASVTFSPEHIGKYKITCQFNHLLKGHVDAGGEIVAEVNFRISDGTTASPAAKVLWNEKSVNASDIRTKVTPITLTLLVDVDSIDTDVTVYLFKRNYVLTELTDNDVCASATNGQLYFLVEKV